MNVTNYMLDLLLFYLYFFLWEHALFWASGVLMPTPAPEQTGRPPRWLVPLILTVARLIINARLPVSGTSALPLVAGM